MSAKELSVPKQEKKVTDPYQLDIEEVGSRRTLKLAVTRTNRETGALLDATMRINGRVVFTLTNGEGKVVFIPPGVNERVFSLGVKTDWKAIKKHYHLHK